MPGVGGAGGFAARSFLTEEEKANAPHVTKELLAAGGIHHGLYETQFRQAIESEQTDSGNGPALDIQALSTGFDVHRITEAAIADVYLLAQANRLYYEYLHTEPTVAGLTEVISEVPEGTSLADKHFVGFYNEGGELVAIMDLITGYPETDNAFIGWFMLDVDHQRKGIGSQLFADVRAALSAQGYNHLELGVITDNKEAKGFWEAQGFAPTGRIVDNGEYSVTVYSRDI